MELTKNQWEYVLSRLWSDIDRIFSRDPRKFLARMTEHDRLTYNISKQQLVSSVHAWWKAKDLKPLQFEPKHSIEVTRKEAFSGILESVENSTNAPHRLLEIALINMFIVPNILQISETMDAPQRYDKYKSDIGYIKGNIKHCVKTAFKYSDIGYSEG